MTNYFAPLNLPCGQTLKNRIGLAPLTNMQSHEDGNLSEEEIHWLSMRAQGGFAMTMTAAAYAQANGQGFSGQFGISDEQYFVGLCQLAEKIKAANSLAVVQIQHSGLRAVTDLTHSELVAPSDNVRSGARGLSTSETEQLIADFIEAAERAQRAGFDGVNVHGAHGYIIGQYLSAVFNQRADQYGGSLENRARLLMEIVRGIQQRCGTDFLLSVRLSPERQGVLLSEALETSRYLLKENIDILDISLWDVYKEPVEEEHQGQSLMSYFTELDRGDTALSVVGKIYGAKDIQYCLNAGADMVMLGRAAILHHDFPMQLQKNPDFVMHSLPVTRAYLISEGLSAPFIDYMQNTWDDFII